jgi:hypothetical protein
MTMWFVAPVKRIHCFAIFELTCYVFVKFAFGGVGAFHPNTRVRLQNEGRGQPNIRVCEFFLFKSGVR